MVEYKYSAYLIEKIKTIEKSAIFPENGDFRLALHEIYLSKERNKIEELTKTLAHYYIKKGEFKDYLKAFEKSLITLNSLSKDADEVYNFKNKEIQEFYKNSIEETFCKLN